MGHKKRNVASRSKSSSPGLALPASSVGVVGVGIDDAAREESQSKQSLAEWDDVNYSAIKLECERALTAFRRGNHTKALRLIKDACHRHVKSALVHRCQGTICVKVAGIMDDQTAKHRHLRNAIESAHTACTLAPNSIEFAHFYANLLYEAAQEGKEYDEVVQECERALSIENPIDPAKESFQEEQKIPTAEGRIAHMQQELRSLIQRAHISSISTWMKNLGTGNGEEKFRLIQFRRPPEDPMEVRFVQTRRPNEIKKATKTPEERRKEIEVRIAAARLLQQKSESQGDESMTAVSNFGGSSHKSGERRKHGSSRKNINSSERKDQVLPYWNSVSYEWKKNLLRIRVDDLRAHFQSSKDGFVNEILSEALSFAEVNRAWYFWVCCRCGEKFADGESHMHHVVQEHMGNLMPKLQSVLPQFVDSEWLEMLPTCSWKPLDLIASIRMLEPQLRFEDVEFGDKFGKENVKEESNDCCTDSYCAEDAWGSFYEKKNLVHYCNSNSLESGENGRDLNLDCTACGENRSSKTYTLPNTWPLSDDTECAKFLEKIGSIFQSLIKHKFLAVGHLQKVIQFSMDELQGLAPGSPLLNCGIDQTPLCICFLGSDQLKKVLKFLQEISHACGVSRYPDKVGPNDTKNWKKLSASEEKIVLDEDASFLFLDESLLPNDDGIKSKVLPMTSAIVGTENSIQSSSDSFLSWIFAGPSTGELLATWSSIREERTHQATELLQLLEKEFGHLQSMCERKYEHLGYEEALQGLEELCLEESKKGKCVTESARCSYDSVLRKRRGELMEGENDAFNRFELDVITSVLKEAINIKASQFGDEETYVGVNSHLCDLESGEEDSKSKDYLNQADVCAEIAIHRQKEQLAVELSKIDARLMRNIGSIEQLEDQLESISALDYRSILLPLVKSFLRANLEDLAEKDATKRSDAAREALLAEIASDSKKNVGGGSDHSKQEKVKDKKKNKDSRRIKDTKITCSDEHLAPSGPDSCSVASGGDYEDPEFLISEGADDFKRMDEDFRRRIELEAEERKLEETLEYQRQIENEAKQKHLAEQWRRHSQIDSECVVEGSASVSSQHCMSADGHCQQGVLKLNNGSPNTCDGIQRNSAGGATSLTNCSAAILANRSKSSQSHQPAKVREGLLNGKIPGNDAFNMEQWTGRKGKRRGNVKLPERRHQGVPSGKENINVGISQVDAQQNEQNGNHDGFRSGNVVDGGSKTLRQLHAEEDDEERFQADLEQAVRQSLDTFQAHQKMPLVSNLKTLQKIPQPDFMNAMGELMGSNESKLDIYGTGLQNEVGEYNCFLNVIIQSLWHLRRFREEFLNRQTTDHAHVGNPCVVCALYDILSSMSKASVDAKRETVAPTSLRAALSNLYPESNFFQEGQMNDASEVLAVIFECLHKSFTFASSASDDDSVESNSLGTWDCASSACIAHGLFGMDIFERMNCYNCSLESRHLKYTSFFHNINASALRTMKVMIPESSFDELLNMVEMNHQLACDPEAGGCGKLNHIHHILSTPPHVLTTVLGWQNTCENVDDIIETLAALDTVIDISVLYRGLDPKNMHRLVSVVCYYGQHYHCFAYSQDSEEWIMYDDKTVKVIGTWEDVLSMCSRGHLQPQVLFYEAVN